MNNSPLLQCTDVRKAFPKPDGEELLVLEGMNLELREGQIVGLLGRSGSGKSTLLRLIAGLAEPSAGQVQLPRASRLSGPARGIAMVFQSFALFPWLTVFENVALGLEAQNLPRAEIRKRSLAAIDLDRPRRVRVRLSARVVGRHAAARGIRARAGGASEHSAHGRAVLRARRADGGDAAHRFPGSVGGRAGCPSRASSW